MNNYLYILYIILDTLSKKNKIIVKDIKVSYINKHLGGNYNAS